MVRDVCPLSIFQPQKTKEMLRKLSQSLARLESRFCNMFTPFQSHGMLMPSYAGFHPEMNQETNLPSTINEIIGDILLMAAPKSKV